MYQLYDDGETWESHCSRAGVKTKATEPVPDEVYFENLKKTMAALGREPKTSERKKFGLNFGKARWPTLSAFIQEARTRGIIAIPERAVSHAGERWAGANVPAEQPVPTAPPSFERRPVPPIPSRTRRKNLRWEQSGLRGFPYAPNNEQGVVAIFAILCAQAALPLEITDINGGKGIDATCYNHDRQADIRVEFKYRLSRHTWNHKTDEIDLVVCWENRWPEFPKEKILILKDWLARSPGDLVH